MRILFVTSVLPVPTSSGSAQRTSLLIRALAELGEVELFLIGRLGEAPKLTEAGYRVAGGTMASPATGKLFGAAAGLAERIAKVLLPGSARFAVREDIFQPLRTIFENGRYDVAVGRYLGDSSRAGLQQLVPNIIDVDDLDSQKVGSWLEMKELPFLLSLPGGWVLSALRRAELGRLAAASYIWTATEEDAGNIGHARVQVLPNIPFETTPEYRNSPQGGDVLFVGSLDYRINRNAVERFLSVSWRSIKAVRPDLRLRIVGGGLDQRTRQRWSEAEGVTVVGYVKNLAEEYARASLAIVPIWEGGGTKIKVLEALAFGRTCVVAAPSTRGYADLIESQTIAPAVTEDDFAAGVVRLCQDHDVRWDMEKRGQALVADRYGYARVRDAVHRVVAEVVKASTSGHPAN